MSNLVLGKLALVTGAGSGIGRAACNILAREGASIIAADKIADAASKTISSMEASGGHMPLQIDVSCKTSINNALETILKKHEKPPSIIVNCAGITKDNFLLKMSEEDFDDVINVNLKVCAPPSG